ncbi:MAG: alpha/beta fold hydrolase [Chitinophagaceae bacterium]|nr:alpha/beta fold hydrolase [Chitinophagaceae bacterium]
MLFAQRKTVFFFILFFVFVISILPFAYAQTNPFVGTWNGLLKTGSIELQIVFHIRQDSTGRITSSMDSPDQNAYGIPCDKTEIKDQNIQVEITKLFLLFSGKLLNDSVISGTFTQGIQFPLELKKSHTGSLRPRPQHPKPPFPYKSEEITFYNSTKTIRYGATITIPQGEGPFPAAVMITGSGPQDRDETIFGHKPFWVIADFLTRNGFIILRVDDRGVGKSSGNFADATSMDFASDVSAAVDYLLTRPEINLQKIGLIGHSEGGMIAPVVANKRKNIHFLILLAAPGVKISELMAEQNYAVLKSRQISEKTSNYYTRLFKKVNSLFLKHNDSALAVKKCLQYLNRWVKNIDTTSLKELQLESPENRIQYAKNMYQSLRLPWLRYFMQFNPQPYLKKLKGNVLALFGEKDIQVTVPLNSEGMKKALQKSKAVFEIMVLPGLNHLFQTCRRCTVDEYASLEETFSPAALDIMKNWLQKYVK